MHEYPDLTGMLFDLYLHKPAEILGKFTAKLFFLPLQNLRFVFVKQFMVIPN